MLIDLVPTSICIKFATSLYQVSVEDPDVVGRMNQTGLDVDGERDLPKPRRLHEDTSEKSKLEVDRAGSMIRYAIEQAKNTKGREAKKLRERFLEHAPC